MLILQILQGDEWVDALQSEDEQTFQRMLDSVDYRDTWDGFRVVEL
jgi:hypothetical protein